MTCPHLHLPQEMFEDEEVERSERSPKHSQQQQSPRAQRSERIAHAIFDDDGTTSPTTDRTTRRIEAFRHMDGNFIIKPEGRFRKRWDFLQILALAYVAAAVPYRIGFSHATEPFAFWFWFDTMVDVYFMFDLFLSFRTAYYDGRGEVQYFPRQIARNYLRSWFLVDTLGCLPISYIVLIIERTSPEGSVDAQSARFNKAFRLLHIARLLKLARLFRMSRLIQRYEEEYYALAAGFTVTKILFGTVVFGHMLACTWYYFGSVDETALVNWDGSPVECWVGVEFGDHSHLTRKHDYLHRYLTSFYWSIQTIAGVGYGDIVARTHHELLTAVFAMSIGGLVFGTILGVLSDVVRIQGATDRGSRGLT